MNEWIRGLFRAIPYGVSVYFPYRIGCNSSTHLCTGAHHQLSIHPTCTYFIQRIYHNAWSLTNFQRNPPLRSPLPPDRLGNKLISGPQGGLLGDVRSRFPLRGISIQLELTDDIKDSSMAVPGATPDNHLRHSMPPNPSSAPRHHIAPLYSLTSPPSPPLTTA